MKHSLHHAQTLETLLRIYAQSRPLFLSLIRSKEAYLYQRSAPLKGPVLDVGCGDGFFASASFSKYVKGSIIGLDLSDSRMKESTHLQVYDTLVEFDGVHIPYPDASFPTVVSNCVLEHVSSLAPLVSDIYRVTKPGGVFLTTVMARPWEDYLAGALLMGHSYKQWMRHRQVHLNLYTSSQWERLFVHAGFQIEKQVGYLSSEACRLIDICHYISLPSLATYMINGEWVWFPSLVSRILPLSWMAKKLQKEVPPHASGAIFYVLRRPL